MYTYRYRDGTGKLQQPVSHGINMAINLAAGPQRARGAHCAIQELMGVYGSVWSVECSTIVCMVTSAWISAWLYFGPIARHRWAFTFRPGLCTVSAACVVCGSPLELRRTETPQVSIVQICCSWSVTLNGCTYYIDRIRSLAQALVAYLNRHVIYARLTIEAQSDHGPGARSPIT